MSFQDDVRKYVLIDNEILTLTNNLKKLRQEKNKYNEKIIDIKDFEIKFLDIFSREVLEMIKMKNDAWEDFLPKGIPEIIKKNKIFCFK